jgi:hypothetical protein
MDKIEIICTVAVAVVTVSGAVLGGVWFILKQIFKLGEYSNRFKSTESDIGGLKSTSISHSEALGKIETIVESTETTISKLPCASHSEDLGKIKTTVEAMGATLSKQPCASHSEDLGKIKATVESMGATLSKLPCASHSEALGKIETIVESIGRTINKLSCASHSEDLGKIKMILIREYPLIAFFFGLRGSPRRLSEYGLRVFADIDGANFLNDNKESLFKCITDSKPLTAFDVEQMSCYACVSLTVTPAFNKIKDYIYNASPIDAPNGEKHELTLNDVCFILGIPLRDMYLEEIGITEV